MTSLFVTSNGMPRLVRPFFSIPEQSIITDFEKLIISQEDTMQLSAINNSGDSGDSDMEGLPITRFTFEPGAENELSLLYAAYRKHLERHRKPPLAMYVNIAILPGIAHEVYSTYNEIFDGYIRVIGVHYEMVKIEILDNIMAHLDVPPGVIICQ